MNKENYIQIGQIYREHGVKGLLKAYIYSQSDDNLFEGQKMIIEKDGKEIAAELTDISTVGRYFLLKFDCFSQPEQIQDWRKAGIYIAKGDLQRDEDDDLYDFEWEGFEIRDQQDKRVGEVQRIVYSPMAQFEVELENEEWVLIPYVEDWFLDVNKDKKVLKIELPEGLVEY